VTFQSGLGVIVTTAVSCCVSKIQRDIGRKCRILSRVSILTRDIDIAILSVGPSVCLSVRHVLVLDENRLTYCHSFFHRTVAQSFKFYQHQTSSRNSDGFIPAGAINTGGV